MFETMASFMLVEHANGAMFDPAGARDLPAGRCAFPVCRPGFREPRAGWPVPLRS